MDGAIAHNPCWVYDENPALVNSRNNKEADDSVDIKGRETQKRGDNEGDAHAI